MRVQLFCQTANTLSDIPNQQSWWKVKILRIFSIPKACPGCKAPCSYEVVILKNYLAICATCYPRFTEGGWAQTDLQLTKLWVQLQHLIFQAEKFTSFEKDFFSFLHSSAAQVSQKGSDVLPLVFLRLFHCNSYFPLPPPLYLDKPGVHVWSVFWFLRNCRGNATSLVSFPEGRPCEPVADSAG